MIASHEQYRAKYYVVTVWDLSLDHGFTQLLFYRSGVILLEHVYFYNLIPLTTIFIYKRRKWKSSKIH